MYTDMVITTPLNTEQIINQACKPKDIPKQSKESKPRKREN